MLLDADLSKDTKTRMVRLITNVNKRFFHSKIRLAITIKLPSLRDIVCADVRLVAL